MNRIVYLTAIIFALLLTGCRGAKLSVADEQMARGEYHDASKTFRLLIGWMYRFRLQDRMTLQIWYSEISRLITS